MSKFNMYINNSWYSKTGALIRYDYKSYICMAGVVFVEDFWLVSAGFPSVSRNRDAYQSIDQQDESSSPANPFNQAQDSKPARTY